MPPSRCCLLVLMGSAAERDLNSDREPPTGCRTRRPLVREVGTGPRCSGNRKEQSSRAVQHVVSMRAKTGYWSDIPGRRQSSTSDKLRRHTTSYSKASSAHARLHVDAGALKERRAGSECWSWRPVTCGQRMEPGVKAHLLVRQEHISTLAHLILPSAIPVGHNSGRRGDDQPARHERKTASRGRARYA